jgi:hypothetical protein
VTTVPATKATYAIATSSMPSEYRMHGGITFQDITRDLTGALKKIALPCWRVPRDWKTQRARPVQ